MEGIREKGEKGVVCYVCFGRGLLAADGISKPKIIFIVYLAFGGALVVFGRGFCARWFKLRFIFIQKNYL